MKKRGEDAVFPIHPLKPLIIIGGADRGRDKKFLKNLLSILENAIELVRITLVFRLRGLRNRGSLFLPTAPDSRTRRRKTDRIHNIYWEYSRGQGALSCTRRRPGGCLSINDFENGFSVIIHSLFLGFFRLGPMEPPLKRPGRPSSKSTVGSKTQGSH